MSRFAVRVTLALAAVTALLGSPGCSRGFAINTPAGFAELEDQEPYGYRATSAEGVVIAVRREDNQPWGDLHFWAGAVDAHLRRDGYVAQKVKELKSADGVPGRQLRYRRTRASRPHIFWATVFSTDEAVVVVETGGDQAYFEQAEKAVSAAIASLRVR